MRPWIEHAENDALLTAVESLEDTLAIPEHGYHRVLAGLRSLEEALTHHIDSGEGVYREIDGTRSTLVRRVDRHRREHADLLRWARALLHGGENPGQGDAPPTHELRHRVRCLLKAVRQHQAVEHGLVFESAYTDIGTGD